MDDLKLLKENVSLWDALDDLFSQKCVAIDCHSMRGSHRVILDGDTAVTRSNAGDLLMFGLNTLRAGAKWNTYTKQETASELEFLKWVWKYYRFNLSINVVNSLFTMQTGKLPPEGY